jgi:hypothetical protein
MVCSVRSIQADTVSCLLSVACAGKRIHELSSAGAKLRHWPHVSLRSTRRWTCAPARLLTDEQRGNVLVWRAMNYATVDCPVR